MRFCSRFSLLVFWGVASACYVYTPAPGAPGPGTRLVLELNDRGRVGLGDSIGPSGQVVEGTVAANSDSAYSLRVVRVGYLNGQSNAWNGEPLRVSREWVGNATERKFSKGRTWLSAGAVSLGALVFVASRGLLGFGSAAGKKGGGPPGQQ
jgi:hypothetical protein